MTPFRLKRSVSLISAIFGLSTLAIAQTPSRPDAGSLINQIKRGEPSENVGPTEQSKLMLPASKEEKSDLKVSVKSFQFNGNTLISSEHLQGLVSTFVNQSLTFTDLQKILPIIIKEYRKHDWLVSAYLPKQDVTEGNIVIQIVEAHYGGERLNLPKNSNIKTTILKGFLSNVQPRGDFLNLKKIDRPFLLATDLPGVAVSAALSAGEKEAETILDVTVINQPRVLGFVSLDNQGSRSTGEQRATAGAIINSPLRLGDSFSVNALLSEGTSFANTVYTVPIGYSGLRAGLNYSYLNYSLVAQEFKPLKANGYTDNVGITLNYPLFRGRNFNLASAYAYDARRLHNESAGLIQSHYTVNTSTFSFVGNFIDEVLGSSAITNFNLGYVSGLVDYEKQDFSELPSLAGQFDKFKYTLSREQTLPFDLSLFANVNGQEASKNLDSSERFYLGGPSGVRAYPGSEGSGSSGQLATLELRWKFKQNWQAFVFYDWGSVRNHNNVAPNYELSGAGLGLEWKPIKNLSVKTQVAGRINDNPNPTFTGMDQDGSLIKPRAWLAVIYLFN